MELMSIGGANGSRSPFYTETERATEDAIREFVRRIDLDGSAVVKIGEGMYVASRNIAGMPTVAHDDVRWAENRFEEGSMAAYYENGEAYGGRWFEPTSSASSTMRRKYGIDEVA